MKYLCLAYGDGDDWDALSGREQRELLAQDDRLRARGDMVEAVGQEGTVVQAWDGEPALSVLPFARGSAPLAGFSIVEAESLEEAVALIRDTPCARAKGAVEVWPIVE